MASHEKHRQGAHDNAKRLQWAALLTGGFMLAEVLGGLLSGSLTLLADAGHMLTDTVSLVLALIALQLSSKPPDRLRSYGYHRVQILAAFLNGIFFVLIVIWIAVEAIQRLFQPVEILAGPMLLIAIMGLLVNLIAFFLLHTGQHANLNMRAASLHVAGDLLGSIAAIGAAGVILFTGWSPIDPILSILVCVLILRSAWGVIKESTHILLEGAPHNLDTHRLKQTLIASVDEVNDVHHIHLWSLTPEHPLLSLHASVTPQSDATQVLRRIKSVLSSQFSILHSTIQLEPGACTDLPDEKKGEEKPQTHSPHSQ